MSSISNLRQNIYTIDKETKKLLKKTFPKTFKTCECIPDTKALYPSAIKKALNDTICLSILELCTKALLSEPVLNINKNKLTDILNEFIPDEDVLEKALKSPTTQRYLNSIKATKQTINSLCKEGTKCNINLSFMNTSCNVDISSEDSSFLISVCSDVKTNWFEIMCELLCLEIFEEGNIYLVLPLHGYVHFFDFSEWNKSDRKEFKRLMIEFISKNSNRDEIVEESLILKNEFSIGNHVSKKDLYETISKLNPKYPYQIFLESNLTTKKVIPDEVLSKVFNEVQEKNLKIYVHSPYTINCCTPFNEKEGYHFEMLKNNLKYSKALGFKGAVVHTGKSTSLGKEKGLENMKEFIRLILEYSSEECPLLLETPCGCGSELLSNSKEFADFILEINDSRLGVCVDLCHIFVSGENPSSYLEYLFDKNIIPKLIHFNDSVLDLGSKRDLHEQIGLGKIGLEELRKCAQMCKEKNIDMLIE
jgi:deoxyribonuclease-4